MTPEERELLRVLLDAVEGLEDALFGALQRHRALLETLLARGAITKAEYAEALKAREAARAVDSAVGDPDAATRRKDLYKAARRLLEQLDDDA